MKICLIGNCQIAALRPMLQAMHSNLEITRLPAVHTMRAQHESEVAAAARDADWIFAQLVAPDYPTHFITADALRQTYGARVVVWPNLYFTGYAPEYNTLRNEKYNHFSGPLLDYHSDKILIGFMKGWSIAKVATFLERPSMYDEHCYYNAITQSVLQLKKREESTDINISDFIEENYVDRRLFHIMNHPAAILLEELASRLLEKISVTHNRVPAFLFGDLELLSAWHPENAFTRSQCRFAFPECRLYRGVQMKKANNALGVSPGGPRVYDELRMVEAMYAFYEPHRAVLSEHPRVKQILQRLGEISL